MKKLRKVNTSARKKMQKELEAKLATQMSLFMKHPTECCCCHLPFERTHETVKAWQVVIREERVRLSCPDCWALVRETLESADAT